MLFLMLMIPNVYRNNPKLEGFAPELSKLEPMVRFNEDLGKSVKILSWNGLHPLHKGVRVTLTKSQPTVTDGPYIET